jgi:glycosyltransferase involved in cell wall biosynthesis
MPDLPTISLVVLYFEQPDNLGDLINCLNNLTQRPDELVIVDDASGINPFPADFQDATGHRTKVIRNAINLGPVGAMNVGLDAVTGDYVHFLACDDTLSPEYYLVAREHFARAPEVGIYSTNTWVTNSTGQTLGVHTLPQPTVSPKLLAAKEVSETLFKKGSWFAGNATLFATEPLRNIGGFDEALEEFSDAFACYILSGQLGAFFEPRPLAWKCNPAAGRNMTIYCDRVKSRSIRKTVASKMRNEFSYIFATKFIRRFERRWKFNEHAIRFYNSDEQVSGSTRLSPFARAWIAVLFLIYRPTEFFERIVTRRRAQIHPLD